MAPGPTVGHQDVTICQLSWSENIYSAVISGTNRGKFKKKKVANSLNITKTKLLKPAKIFNKSLSKMSKVTSSS